jgi:hypothetical protein
VVIGMKPFEDYSKLTNITGLYFEPVDPTSETVCPGDIIPTECEGTIALDLSNDSTITFDWVGSTMPRDKYISLEIDGSVGTVQFEFYAKYACNDDQPYQVITGQNISYSFRSFDDDASFNPPKYAYDKDKSFIELGKWSTSSSTCKIFSKISFDVDLTDGGTNPGLSLDFSSFSATAQYDNTNVIQGEQIYGWSTRKYNWIQLEGVSELAEGFVTYEIKDQPYFVKPSAAPSEPKLPPTVSPSPSPSVSPSSTSSVQPSGSPSVNPSSSPSAAPIRILVPPPTGTNDKSVDDTSGSSKMARACFITIVACVLAFV